MFRRVAVPSSATRPAQPRKTNRQRIYRTDVALTGKNNKQSSYQLPLIRDIAGNIHSM